MIKIAFVVNKIIFAGPINVLYNIVANIDREKFEPVILALKNNVEKRSRVKDFEKLGIKLHFFNFSFLQMELRTKKCAKILDNFVEENGIKILHLHGYHPLLIASYLQSRAKKMNTLHSLCYEDFIQRKGVLIGNYMAKRFCSKLKYMDSCISITDYMKDYYKKYRQDITTIYNGINSNAFFTCNLDDKQKLRKEYNIPFDSTVFIVCNSLNKGKNTIAFINAANKFTDGNRKFIIVGDGPEGEKLKEAAKNKENIIFMGRQSNVAPYLQMSDYFVTTSKSEGFGLAPVEALFCGISIIYSDIPVYKELFYSRKELQPYMFNLKSEEDLYQKLKIATPVENIQEIAEYYRENFSAKKMSEKYQEVYFSLLNS